MGAFVASPTVPIEFRKKGRYFNDASKWLKVNVWGPGPMAVFLALALMLAIWHETLVQDTSMRSPLLCTRSEGC